MMKLLDFTALFQLCATFYVVFIVIEYAKSFTFAIENNLFGFSDKLKKMSMDCKMDEKADLDEFQGNRFKSGKPFKFLESTKTKIVDLNEKVDRANSELQRFISLRCRFEQFRNISLFMFVYCIEMLILVGLESWDSHFVYAFISVHLYFSIFFVSISFLAGLLGVLSDEKHRYKNVVITILFILIAIIFSFLSAYGVICVYDNSDRVSLYLHLLFSALLPLVVFFIGILYVWVNGMLINHEINNKFSPIAEEKKVVLNLIEEWRTHDKVEDRYEENA